MTVVGREKGGRDGPGERGAGERGAGARGREKKRQKAREKRRRSGPGFCCQLQDGNGMVRPTPLLRA